MMYREHPYILAQESPFYAIVEPSLTDSMKKTSSLLWFVLIVAVLAVGAILAFQAQRAIHNGNLNGNLSALTNNSAIDWAAITKAENTQHTDDPTLYDITLVAKSGEKTPYTTVKDLFADAAHWYQFQNGNLYILKRVGYEGINDTDWSDELWKVGENKQQTMLAAGKGIDYLVAPNDATVALLEGQQITMIDLVRKTDRVFTADQVSLSNDALTTQFLAWSSDSSALWGYSWHSSSPNFFRLNAPGWTIGRYDVPELPFGGDFALNPNTGLLAYSTYPLFLDAKDETEFRQSGKEVVLNQYNVYTQKRESLAQSSAAMFRPTWKDDSAVEYNNPSGSGIVTKAISLDEQILATSHYKPDSSEQSDLYQACPSREPEFETVIKQANASRKLFMLNGALPIVMTENPNAINNAIFLDYGQDQFAYCGPQDRIPLHATQKHLFWGSANCGVNPDDSCAKAEQAIQDFEDANNHLTVTADMTLTLPNGWTMQRGYGKNNSIQGAPYKSIVFSVAGKNHFSSSDANILWYNFNPEAALADVAGARFPNNASGTIIKRDEHATIGAKSAYFLTLDGSRLEEPSYQASFWFVRVDSNTIAEISARYPNKQIFDAENSTVQKLLNSLTFFANP